MKKTINAAIGGCSFTIDEDAYNDLETYLTRFRSSLDNTSASNEVMEELEMRIADLLKEKLGTREVVDISMTQSVISQLGYPENCGSASGQHQESYTGTPQKAAHKLYRDPDDKKLAGVCSGLALFFGIDVVFVRVLFLIALVCGSTGFWLYIVIWLIAPEATTATEKCELRGIPATAENIRRFTTSK